MDASHDDSYIPLVNLPEAELKQSYHKKRSKALSDAFQSSLFNHTFHKKRPPMKSESSSRITDSTTSKDIKSQLASHASIVRDFNINQRPSSLSAEQKARFSAKKEYAKTPREILESTIRVTSHFLKYDHDNNPAVAPDFSSCIGSACYIQHRNNEGGIDDRILTNAHVVSDSAVIYVRSHAHAADYIAIVEHVCPEADVAILHVLDDPSKKPFFQDLKPFKICLDLWPHLSSDVYPSLTTHGYSLGNDYTKTQGHISNVETQTYANSLQLLPIIRTNSAISSGNSGGPATIMAVHGHEEIPHLIGLVFQSSESGQNINSIIPVPLIIKVIEDRLKSPHLRGIPFLDIKTQRVENQFLKQHLGLQDNYGLLVLDIPPLSCAYGYLQKDDILLEINGYKISEKGMINYDFRKNLSFIFEYSFRNIGDRISFKILRDNNILNISLELTRRFLESSKVRRAPQNKLPTFFIASGLVFSIYQLTGLDDDEENGTIYDMLVAEKEKKQHITDECVVLSNVIPHSATQSYSDFVGKKLLKVNGQQINNIVELINLIDNISDGALIILELLNESGVISKIAIPKMPQEEHLSLLEQHQIFADRSLFLESDRIDDYFDYQTFDNIIRPSRYMRIFKEKGPFEAMMDNYYLKTRLLSGQDASGSENDDERSSEALPLDQQLRSGASQALDFLRDVFSTNEIAYLLNRAIERGKHLDSNGEYQQMLSALCQEAMRDQLMRERFFLGGLTQKKEQQALLKRFEKKIQTALSSLSSEADIQEGEEALSLQDIIGFCVAPLIASDEQIRALEEAQEEESSAPESETLDGSQEADSRDNEMEEEAGSLEDFIEADSDNEEAYKMVEAAKSIVSSRPRISFGAPPSSSSTSLQRRQQSTASQALSLKESEYDDEPFVLRRSKRGQGNAVVFSDATSDTKNLKKPRHK